MAVEAHHKALGPELRPHAVAVGLLFVASATLLICTPFLRTIKWLGDEGVLLQGADRILRGERLYIDFFEFLPPGGFLLTAGWLAATEVSFVAARLLAILVIGAIACLTYLACTRASGSLIGSIAGTLTWVVMTQGELMELSHNWLATFFCLVTFYALLRWAQRPERRLWLPLLAGLAGGAASMITPNRGALALLAGLVAFADLRRDRAAFVSYCAAALVVPMALLAHTALQGALPAAFDSVVVHTLSRYAAINVIFPHPTALIFVTGGLFVFLLILRDGRRILSDETLRLCIAFALTAAVGLLTRADGPHVGYALPMALPLILLSAWRLTSRRIRPILAGILGVCVVVKGYEVGVNAWTSINLPLTHSSRGFIRLHDRNGADLDRLLLQVASLPSQDAIFVYPYSPLFPFLAARNHSARVNVLIPGYTTRVQYAEACRDSLRDARWLVLDQRWTSAHWIGQFPAITEPGPPERMLLEKILDRASVPVGSYGFHALRRLVNTDASDCDAIAADAR